MVVYVISEAVLLDCGDEVVVDKIVEVIGLIVLGCEFTSRLVVVLIEVETLSVVTAGSVEYVGAGKSDVVNIDSDTVLLVCVLGGVC